MENQAKTLFICMTVVVLGGLLFLYAANAPSGGNDATYNELRGLVKTQRDEDLAAAKNIIIAAKEINCCGQQTQQQVVATAPPAYQEVTPRQEEQVAMTPKPPQTYFNHAPASMPAVIEESRPRVIYRDRVEEPPVSSSTTITNSGNTTVTVTERKPMNREIVRDIVVGVLGGRGGYYDGYYYGRGRDGQWYRQSCGGPCQAELYERGRRYGEIDPQYPLWGLVGKNQGDLVDTAGYAMYRSQQPR